MADNLQVVASLSKAVDESRRKTDKLRECRDEEIQSAHRAGFAVSEIAKAAGLTRTMIYKILGC